MKKDMSLVSNGLVINVNDFKKSTIKGWIDIYSKTGEQIGGFSLIDNKLVVIHEYKINSNLYLTYSLRDRKEVK